MFNRVSRIGVLGLAVLMAESTAQAGLLSANSAAAIPAFTGSKIFNDTNAGFTVNATVDFAVFAPGTYSPVIGIDPSGGAHYVYAYQIENFGPNIGSFTVGLDGDETLGAIGFQGAGLIDPSSGAYVGNGPTSAAWDFSGSTLGNGDTSAVLIFTSADAPTEDSATVTSAWSNTQLLPSPVPEPATFALISLGLGLLCSRERSRA